jgi:dTDP-4-amino-4,6-dideoxygalactose transaminase
MDRTALITEGAGYIGEANFDAASAVCRCGWLTQRPLTRTFEAAIEACTGAPHAIAVSNCTATLHLIDAAVGLAPQ